MFLIIINKSVPEISIPLLKGGVTALFGPIGLAPMHMMDRLDLLTDLVLSRITLLICTYSYCTT